MKTHGTAKKMTFRVMALWLALFCSAFASKQELLILKEVKLQNATLEEALAYLNIALRQVEGFEDPHLNLVVLGAPRDGARINLDLHDVPARLVYEQVARMVGMKLRIDNHAIALVPSDWPDAMHTRVYRVPPDFIWTGSAAK